MPHRAEAAGRDDTPCGHPPTSPVISTLSFAHSLWSPHFLTTCPPARACVAGVDQVPTDPEVEAQLVAEENAEVLADDETRPLTKTW